MKPDRLFEDVERWRNELEWWPLERDPDAFLRRFGLVVTAVFVLLIVGLVLAVLLN